MTSLILRLAGPIQTWAGYRVAYKKVPTHPTPTKSGVAGLLGACLGSRDLDTLMTRFALRVRVDQTNPIQTDLQVATGPKPHEAARFERARTLAAGVKARPLTQLTGTGDPGFSQRDYIPAAEFICQLAGDPVDVEQWASAARDPVFMPYLGRRANAPAFPFILGVHAGTDDVLETIPTVAPANSPAPSTRLRVYTVTGTYHQHTTDLTTLDVPVAHTREEQLEWAAQHLN